MYCTCIHVYLVYYSYSCSIFPRNSHVLPSPGIENSSRSSWQEPRAMYVARDRVSERSTNGQQDAWINHALHTAAHWHHVPDTATPSSDFFQPFSTFPRVECIGPWRLGSGDLLEVWIGSDQRMHVSMDASYLKFLKFLKFGQSQLLESLAQWLMNLLHTLINC